MCIGLHIVSHVFLSRAAASASSQMSSITDVSCRRALHVAGTDHLMVPAVKISAVRGRVFSAACATCLEQSASRQSLQHSHILPLTT